MVGKLLKHKISKKQLLSFIVVNIVGLSIVFLGFQLYKDIKPIVIGDDSIYDNSEYIVLTKKISSLGNVLGSNSFSDNELRRLKQQDFIEDVGAFDTSLFNVRAGINISTLPINLATDLFFEAIPDEFIDVKPVAWTFDEESTTIPIILPKSYLDLYNFGFAASRKLPQLSEESMGNISLDINISSQDHFAESYKGKIVGFSKRINSILVPQEFLTYANKEFANSESKPSRVIIKVGNTADKELATYISDNGYQIDGEQLNASKNSNLLYIVTAIVLIIGALICLLSCYILILSIYLLLEKNLTTLENLRLLGYSIKQIARPYRLLVVLVSGIAFISSLLVTYLVRLSYLSTINKITPSTELLGSNLSLATYALALLGFIVLTLISLRLVKARVNTATKFI